MSSDAPQIGRRHVLLGTTATAVSALAGCGSFSGPETETGQSARVRISLSNPTDAGTDYEVEVTWSEGNRSQFTGSLESGESDSEMVATTATAPDSASFSIGGSGDGMSSTWNPTECQDYRVDAVVGDGMPSIETSCEA